MVFLEGFVGEGGRWKQVEDVETEGWRASGKRVGSDGPGEAAARADLADSLDCGTRGNTGAVPGYQP